MNKTEMDALPAGWSKCKLIDCGEIVSGGTPSTKIPEYWGDEICWVTPGDLSGYENKYISRGQKSLSKIGLLKSSAQLMPKGSVLFSSRAPIGYTVIASNDLCTNQGFKSIVPNDAIYNEFLYYFLKSAKQSAEDYASGTTFKELSMKAFSQIPIKIPPCNEQHRIVSKIEELFSELDKGMEALKTAQQQLQIYRQAVRKWAFEGKLTEEWRKQQGFLPTAAQLMEEIKTAREKQAKAAGKKLKIVVPLTQDELEELPIVPHGWSWVRPVGICSDDQYSIGIGPFGSNLKVSDYQPSGVPLIFVKNITRNDFALDLKFISEDKFKELMPHSAMPLDILITKMGDPPGDCTIYPEDRPIGIITSDCLKFRVNEKYTDRKFIKYCMETNLIKKQFGLITKGVAQKKISAERFKSILFPFPSKKEQQQIVQEIESRLSVADKLEEAITQSLAQAEALRQSILKKAFEGKLVPQDPNDEPAGALLARIKAVREKNQADRTPRNRQQPRKAR